jgi:hypothetical protein
MPLDITGELERVSLTVMVELPKDELGPLTSYCTSDLVNDKDGVLVRDDVLVRDVKIQRVLQIIFHG